MKKTMHRLSAILCLAIAVCLVFSGCATAGTGDAAASGGASSYSGIIILVVMIAVFYFMLIRPENKKKKAAEEMRKNLSVGDKITTIGGMVGKVVDVSGDLITFETGEDRVRIQVTKWAISTNNIDKSGDQQGK
jgi:preprotein translocase subunit YajC